MSNNTYSPISSDTQKSSSEKGLVPRKKEFLQTLKSNLDEKKRVEQVDLIVNSIYGKVLSQAATDTATQYKHMMPAGTTRFGNNNNMGFGNNNNMSFGNNRFRDPPEVTFFRDNLQEILKKLQLLFPDSIIQQKTLSKGVDGKYYDTADMDEKAKAFIDQRYDQEYIIIDWS